MGEKVVRHGAAHKRGIKRFQIVDDFRQRLDHDHQLGALFDEQAAFVGRPVAGGMLSFAPLDQTMWNYHPRTAAARTSAR